MKIVTVCEQGNNRSVHAAWLVRYNAKHLGSGTNEVLSVGINLFSQETLKMLFDWADIIILTDVRFRNMIEMPTYNEKVHVWDVGPDRFEHNLNKELLDLLRAHMEGDSSFQ